MSPHFDNKLSEYTRLFNESKSFLSMAQEKGIDGFIDKQKDKYPCEHMPCCSSCYFANQTQRDFEDDLVSCIGSLTVTLGSMTSCMMEFGKYDKVSNRILHFFESPKFTVSVLGFEDETGIQNMFVSVDWKSLVKASHRYCSYEKDYISRLKEGSDIRLMKIGVQRSGRGYLPGRKSSVDVVGDCNENCGGFFVRHGDYDMSSYREDKKIDARAMMSSMGGPCLPYFSKQRRQQGRIEVGGRDDDSVTERNTRKNKGRVRVTDSPTTVIHRHSHNLHSMSPDRDMRTGSMGRGEYEQEIMAPGNTGWGQVYTERVEQFTESPKESPRTGPLLSQTTGASFGINMTGRRSGPILGDMRTGYSIGGTALDD